MGIWFVLKGLSFMINYSYNYKTPEVVVVFWNFEKRPSVSHYLRLILQSIMDNVVILKRPKCRYSEFQLQTNVNQYITVMLFTFSNHECSWLSNAKVWLNWWFIHLHINSFQKTLGSLWQMLEVMKYGS